MLSKGWLLEAGLLIVLLLKLMLKGGPLDASQNEHFKLAYIISIFEIFCLPKRSRPAVQNWEAIILKIAGTIMKIFRVRNVRGDKTQRIL